MLSGSVCDLCLITCSKHIAYYIRRKGATTHLLMLCGRYNYRIWSSEINGKRCLGDQSEVRKFCSKRLLVFLSCIIERV